MYIQKKFWKHVEDCILDTKSTKAFYDKETLFLDLGTNHKGNTRGICLSINGKGYVLSDIKNRSIYAPEYITDLVKDLHKKHMQIHDTKSDKG
jgi:hypothetical protein